MKPLDDHKIQELLEKNALSTEITAGNRDAQIYSMLFEILKKEPEMSLPLGFASMVTRRAIVDQAKQIGFKSYLLAMAGSILIGVIFCLALYVLRPEAAALLLSFLFSFKYILILVVAGILMINYLDHKFVRKRTII